MRARHAWLALATVLGASGCNGFLTGPGIDTDPNNPNGLKRPGPLYTSVQALQSVQFEGQLARNVLMYAQQIAGVSRQQIGYDRGTTSPSDIDTYFSAVYGSSRLSTGGGGLLDIRKMQQLARKVDDSLYIGIGKVYEALVIGTAADLWGDIPYREAADSTILTPHFDPQLQVYQDVLAQLDSAITIFLAAAPGGSNLGPPQDNAEIIYAGRDAAGLRDVYTQVAHSLKARFYMHLAEVDPSNYALALAEVPLGIASPANDMLWFHDLSPTGQSVWWQFMATRGDIAPGAALVEILKRRIAAGIEDDARLNYYFLSATGSTDPADFYGFRPGGATDLITAPGVYNGTAPGGNYAGFTFIDPFVFGAPGDFRHPVITWAETQLIGAEAAFQTGGQAAAQPYLDAVRANRTYGSTGGQVVTFPALGSVPATLQNIMEEKYVALFLNMEVWNDYKRTCLPALAPAAQAGSTVPGTSPIPGRLPYGLTEVNANPNTPQVSSTGQNANDPNACPVLDYVSSTPLGN
jgi:hypothetical protein